jgi:hypothetical protein
VKERDDYLQLGCTLADIQIGMRRDQIMQRYLARRIFQERELAIVDATGEERIGFITGIDDEVIQMSVIPDGDESDPRAALVSRYQMTSIEETGRKLTDLPEGVRVKIRDYGSILRAKCHQALTTQGAAAPVEVAVLPDARSKSRQKVGKTL